MNLNSFLLEQALKKLKLSDDSLTQFRLASAAGDVDGHGFPQELFELSAPMIVRGLLNFSVLQMNRDWVYPYWIHQQLDPKSSAFIPRSQNPLLINITHRNWTAIGSPSGIHEAIVDPRGLITPLPREWSVDTWLVDDGHVLFPSLSTTVDQRLDPIAPRVMTWFEWRNLRFCTESFVSAVRGGKDIVFCRARVQNPTEKERSVRICTAIRPFGVEGVAPIRRIGFESHRIMLIDGVVGLVFAQEPSLVVFGSSGLGDASKRLGSKDADGHGLTVSCEKGLANAAAIFDRILKPFGEESVCFSIALGTKAELAASPVKKTWRVSFEKRRQEQAATWGRELEGSASFEFGNVPLQNLYESSRAALLQFQDGAFLSPGPYLYHHFWFRDAAPMLKALDVLGFPKRVRQVVDGFSKRLTSEGFFRAPGGEWDSNGAALWTVSEHYRFTRSLLWLKQLYPFLARSGRWIARMRKSSRNTGFTHAGLMPKSLSAEHLGTVDQYYWDSFWSLAGLRALASMANEVQHEADARSFEKEAIGLEHDLLTSFRSVEQRLGSPLIPSTPFRSFDESAIGSICSIYPLNLFDTGVPQPLETLKCIADRFLDDRGFYHPIVHSGYNAYLTLQVAHAFLHSGDIDRAWTIAESMFRQATSTYTYPEAIHPKTGGGSMGDGHHGWAAAEVVLFLRDCLLREHGNGIDFFAGAGPHLMTKGRDIRIVAAPTAYGKMSVSLKFESEQYCNLSVESKFVFKSRPEFVDVFLPWKVRKVIPSSPQHLVMTQELPRGVRIRFSPDVSTAIILLGD